MVLVLIAALRAALQPEWAKHRLGAGTPADGHLHAPRALGSPDCESSSAWRIRPESRHGADGTPLTIFGRVDIMGMPGMLAAGWGGMIRLVAHALGVEVEEIREVYERDFATEAFECAMMRVEKGQCGAVRFEVAGIVDGRPLIVAEHVNRLGLEQAPQWPEAPEGRRGVHRCIVTGNPGVQLECFTRGEDGDHNTGGVQATALRVINAIPAVCAHGPGIVSTLDLPYTPSSDLSRG